MQTVEEIKRISVHALPSSHLNKYHTSMPSSSSQHAPAGINSSSPATLILPIPFACSCPILKTKNQAASMLSCLLRTRKNKDKAPVRDGDASTDHSTYVDPPQFTLRSLTAATCNFAAAKNKMGQQERWGDLGPVFKGKLEDGQVVAVRRLPATYWQSFQFHELKDELVFAAKLKHENIVQLLGVCLDQREKLLVYEYLPNLSLETILFDTVQRRQRHLDWEKRYSIIRGIARGLLYLHGLQYLHKASALGINHECILRPSKILLDDDMNPKILDAGIPPPNTENHCVAIPYKISGYTAPEQKISGITSTKSDMFSFGVILLEMVTGRGIYYDWCIGKMSQNGISYVWDKWKARSIADIADASLGHRYRRNEMRNCVHIGLLCLQEDPELRPDVLAVMHALEASCPTSLPTPSIPYLYPGRSIT